VEFRTGYHNFMTTGALGWDGPRFQPQGSWVTITTKLLRREEFE